jgi:hypothetical protein
MDMIRSVPWWAWLIAIFPASLAGFLVLLVVAPIADAPDE